MSQTSLLKSVKTALTSGQVTEGDVAKFLNRKLGVTKTKTRTVKHTEYKDGRSNKHAILLAVDAFGEVGCKSAELRTKLKELNHDMSTAVFQTSRCILQNNEKLLKSTGKVREKTFRLTTAGKKELETFQGPVVVSE